MNTAFICIKEQFDTSTSMGRAMMNIAAVFAQLERETIAERVRGNLVLLARTDHWLGGVTPLGFVGEKTAVTDADGKRGMDKSTGNNQRQRRKEFLPPCQKSGFGIFRACTLRKIPCQAYQFYPSSNRFRSFSSAFFSIREM